MTHFAAQSGATFQAACRRVRRRCQAAAVLACAAAVATLLSPAAWAAEAVRPRPAASLEIETMPASLQTLSAPSQRRDAIAQAAYGQPDDSLRARWWWRRGAWSLGAGADYGTVGGPGRSYAISANPVLGLRAELSPNTRLVYELSGVQPRNDGPFGSNSTAQQSRWALEFKASGSQRQALPAGFLRVQLAGGSTLQLRPRGGGLSMAYRSRF